MNEDLDPNDPRHTLWTDLRHAYRGAEMLRIHIQDIESRIRYDPKLSMPRFPFELKAMRERLEGVMRWFDETEMGQIGKGLRKPGDPDDKVTPTP